MLYYSAQQVPPSDRGYVGDWCPVCQEVCVQRTLWLRSRLLMRNVEHQDSPVYAIRCVACRTLRRAGPRYRDTISIRPASALDAAAVTTPDIADRLAERERCFASLCDPACSPDERTRHLEQAIGVVALMVERRVPDSIGHDWKRGIMLRTDVGFVFIPLVLLACFTWFAWTTSTVSADLRPWLTIGTTALVLLLAWRVTRGGRGWARRKLVPRIALASRPVYPTPVEVEIAVRQARVNGSPAARLIDHRQLYRAIRRVHERASNQLLTPPPPPPASPPAS